ncbi:MAG: 3-hydroxyacyl-CoA dehydrogenase NAD-binding domain-containing protein [Gammaproteobacteria bacterium]|nr:3-hydroxyacyl-CoA dehydrogenase NAD-binding domain-containing protein [Gammaproteobacteria bacterium]
MSQIKRVAVLGSGTMGLGIAGMCASAGCDVLLLDLHKESCDSALPRLVAGRTPVLEDETRLHLITTGSFADDMPKIADCQWICEAIVEEVSAKRRIFREAERYRSDGSILSTNTSGIPLRDLYTGMPERLQQDVAVTHFFNPVHAMKLVELVPGTRTRSEAIAVLADFLGNTVGKGVVYAKDTVNFIGNRIGCLWINAGLHLAEKSILTDGLTVEQVDALLSTPMGFPATGLYGLCDLIGIDVMYNVNRNLEENLPENDSSRRFIALPEKVQGMYDRGQLGRKTGGGFYKLIRHTDGSKSMEVFDLAPETWRSEAPVTLQENEQSFRDLFENPGNPGRLVRDLMATTLCYTAGCVPEIADDIVNVDRAMRWGFGWEKGPFQLMDEIGAHSLIALANEHPFAMPNMLQVLIDSGESTFYRHQGTEFLTVCGQWERVPD